MNQQPRKQFSAILLSTDNQFVFSFDVFYFFLYLKYSVPLHKFYLQLFLHKSHAYLTKYNSASHTDEVHLFNFFLQNRYEESFYLQETNLLQRYSTLLKMHARYH